MAETQINALLIFLMITLSSICEAIPLLNPKVQPRDVNAARVHPWSKEQSHRSMRYSPSPGPFREQPFTAVWNVKNSHRCLSRYGVNLNLGSYGIRANKDGTVDGDILAFFSYARLGSYPYIVKGQFVNGGLPQLVNMTSHLEKATVDILTAIPDAKFSGLAVIDWEFWSPAWDKNRDTVSTQAYIKESVALVRRRHPQWDPATVEAVAKLEFEQAAKSLYEGTVLLVRRLRPEALVGFYHYPYCDNHKDAGRCEPETQSYNDQLAWLADASGALYPSIYIKTKETSGFSTLLFVNTILDEAFRVRNKSDDPSKPMYSYCALNYSHTGLYLNLEDLNNTILRSAELGMSGVVLWGDNYDTNNRAACVDLQGYIESALGPLVLETTKAASKCSAALCNGHGRCVDKILECMRHPHRDVQTTSRTPSRVTSNMNLDLGVMDECRCQCYAGWGGPSCAVKKRSSEHGLQV